MLLTCCAHALQRVRWLASEQDLYQLSGHSKKQRHWLSQSHQNSDQRLFDMSVNYEVSSVS